MKDIKNKIKLNMINDYGNEWFGIIFEAWRIEISKDELLYNRKINILDEIIGVNNVEVLDNIILVDLHKYEYENVFEVEYLKEVIDDYINSLEKAIENAGIEKEYSIVFDFFSDNFNYQMELEKNAKEREKEDITINNNEFFLEETLEQIIPKCKKWSIDITNMSGNITVRKAIVKINSNELNFDISLEKDSKMILEIPIVIDTNDVNYFIKKLENIQDNIEKKLRELEIREFEITFK